jgi:hypothetical protein
MSLLQTESVTVNIAPEATLGVQATTAWWEAQPNPGGINDFYAQMKKVRSTPISKRMMHEKGDVVDLDAMPKLQMDLRKDWLDRLGGSMFRTTQKQVGGTGTGFFRPTAVTNGAPSSWTVPSGGALIAGVIVVGRGFTNAANNGIHVLAAGSIAGSIKTNDALVTETPPANATLEVVGYQAAASDFAISAGLALTSTANVLASLGLQQYAWLWIGGGTAAAPGALGFATAVDRGLFRITSVAAGAVGLDRGAAALVADTGAAKTIQIFFGPWLRFVPFDNADYAKLSHTIELVLPKLGAGSVDDYVYALGQALASCEISAPLTGLITATLGFVGLDCTDPTTSRATGASTAFAPLATTVMNTVDEMRRLRVTKTDGTVVLADIQTWKLSLMHNIKPYKRQGGTLAGTPGSVDLIFGTFDASLSIDGSLAQDDLWKAIRANTSLQFESLARAADSTAALFDLPGLTAEGGAPNFPANDVVGFSPTFPAHRDPVTGMVAGMTIFPYLPAN